ncbi:MAG: hypothetical protein N4A45_03870, partial [Flavobacteriales bacterium]|nr:hypothetical protein [Flavobacteriales bacterium]
MLRSTLALFLGAMMSLFTGIFTVEGQVGIGTDSPNTSAILDIESSNRGFLPPRMTEAQMNAINLPAEGLVVYCTDCCTGQGRLVFYNGTIWKTIPGCGNNTTNLLPAADFDGDGIANVDDIDDDNDGILDIHEFGNNSQSFNTAVGAVDPDNNPTTVTLNATSPQEIHLDFTLLDQSLELTVNGQNISASHTVLELQNNWTSSLVFDDGNVMSQPFNASTATGNPPRVKIKITSAGEVIIHGTKTVSDAVYHKMKIQDGSSFNTINFIPGQNEVKFRNPNGQGGDKVIGEMRVYYSEDADNDGIPNNYDPDADNDGCSDAREAGLTNDNTAGFVFPNNNVGTNGYADNLETSADNGVPNYGSINMGTAVLNNSVNICNNQAPTATNPNITGTAQVGQTLTANFTYADNENNPAGTHTYQWYRADNNTGLNRAA